MREPTYYVLASLLDGPLHGYAIIKRTGELSCGRVRLATGTLYTALDRLAAEGYVRLVSEEIVNGRARRCYGLTDSGAAALRADAVRMAEAARIVTGGTAANAFRRARPGRGTGPARPGRQVRTA
jgi:DNA-binding PadR family transcriptional regulator